MSRTWAAAHVRNCEEAIWLGSREIFGKSPGELTCFRPCGQQECLFVPSAMALRPALGLRPGGGRSLVPRSAGASFPGGGGRAAGWYVPGLMSAPGPVTRTSCGSPQARATSMVTATGLVIVSRTGEKRVRAASSATCSSSNSPATLMLTWICW